MKLKSIINAKTDSAELYIYDDIGANPWGVGIMPEDVAAALKDLKDVRSITVRVNSPGGDVYDGMAIYSLFNGAKQRIIMQIDGLAASAAATIVMSGEEIVIADGAELMIHNAWMMAVGDATEMRRQADRLEQTTNQMAKIYSSRSGQPIGTVLSMMDNETWMTASVAYDLGFAEKVIPLKRVAASVRGYQYKHTPDQYKTNTIIVPDKSNLELTRERIAAMRGDWLKRQLQRKAETK
jgi:ATP-dependent protease ClpP protease subunit